MRGGGKFKALTLGGVVLMLYLAVRRVYCIRLLAIVLETHRHHHRHVGQAFHGLITERSACPCLNHEHILRTDLQNTNRDQKLPSA